MSYILAIDQGTSSTKTIVFDANGRAVAKGHVDLATNYYDNGFVEQDPNGIFENVLESVTLCIQDFVNQGLSIENVVSCGISNQRETFVLWNKNGQPLSPAVVWACKRSVNICHELKAKSQELFIKERTGLIIDPYFSATKLLWLLENDADLRTKLNNGEVYFGTIDCWLLWKMTNGQSFKTDYTNAHRTLLFNIHTLQWDTEILKLWGLEKLNLPEVCFSSDEFGVMSDKFLCNIKHPSLITYHLSLPINALIGDSHAAAFGEGCFEAGSAKATLGTGCSILMNIGDKPILSDNGMLTTICWSTNNRIHYALEGAIVSCGSTIEWLKNALHLFEKASETEAMATAVADSGGVYLVPAFSGLGAPHWQMNRRASIEGMTFGTTKNHIVRAALESIVFQIKDVMAAMEQDAGVKSNELMVNGGMTTNIFVLETLANLLNTNVINKGMPDVSALGAAYLAGLQSGVYNNIEQLKGFYDSPKTFSPTQNQSQIQKAYSGWQKKIKA